MMVKEYFPKKSLPRREPGRRRRDILPCKFLHNFINSVKIIGEFYCMVVDSAKIAGFIPRVVTNNDRVEEVECLDYKRTGLNSGSMAATTNSF